MKHIMNATRVFSAIAATALTIATPSLAQAQAPKAETLDKTRVLWQTGKYAEAREAYDSLRKDEKLAADPKLRAKLVLDRADCLNSQGDYDQAIAEVKEFAESIKTSADAWAKLADLQFSRGRWDDAQHSTNEAIKIKADHLLARWTLARLLAAKGDQAKAIEAYQWFITYHNENKNKLRDDAAGLLIVGQATERYTRAKARGEELKDALLDIVDELYERDRGRPELLAGPLAGGEALSLGLQRGRGIKGIDAGGRDQPSKPRGLGHSRRGRPARL